MVNEPFTASNGVTLQPRETLIDWRMEDLGGVLNFNLDTLVDDALAEWYQHRRDVELGRWRDEHDPDMVVYRVPESEDKGGRAVHVIDEATGVHVSLWERDVKRFERGGMHATAARYFAAHPEPKPWHDAKPGEVWVLETELHFEPRVYKVSSRDGYATSNFTQVYNGQPLYTPKDGPISAGHKIWPEESDDE